MLEYFNLMTLLNESIDTAKDFYLIAKGENQYQVVVSPVYVDQVESDLMTREKSFWPLTKAQVLAYTNHPLYLEAVSDEENPACIKALSLSAANVNAIFGFEPTPENAYQFKEAPESIQDKIPPQLINALSVSDVSVLEKRYIIKALFEYDVHQLVPYEDELSEFYKNSEDKISRVYVLVLLTLLDPYLQHPYSQDSIGKIRFLFSSLEEIADTDFKWKLLGALLNLIGNAPYICESDQFNVLLQPLKDKLIAVVDQKARAIEIRERTLGIFIHLIKARENLSHYTQSTIDALSNWFGTDLGFDILSRERQVSFIISKQYVAGILISITALSEDLEQKRMSAKALSVLFGRHQKEALFNYVDDTTIQIMINTLNQSSDLQITYCLLGVFKCLTETHEAENAGKSLIEIISHSGGIKAFCSCFNLADIDVQEKACEVLLNLAKNNKDNQALIRKNDGISKLLIILEQRLPICYRGPSWGVPSSFELIEALALDTDNHDDIVRFGVIKLFVTLCNPNFVARINLETKETVLKTLTALAQNPRFHSRFEAVNAKDIVGQLKKTATSESLEAECNTFLNQCASQSNTRVRNLSFLNGALQAAQLDDEIPSTLGVD